MKCVAVTGTGKRWKGGVENPPFRQRRGSGELPRERGLRLPLNPPKSLL